MRRNVQQSTEIPAGQWILGAVIVIAMLAGVALYSTEARAAGADRAAYAIDPDARVPSISPREFLRRKSMRTAALFIVVDVRTTVEFAVSHLVGAINADVDAPPETLLKSLRHRLSGAALVLYCTHGSRSDEFGLALYQAALAAGVHSVHVVRGGIMRWHDEERPLVDARGPTRFVHPLNPAIRQRMRQPELARFSRSD